MPKYIRYTECQREAINGFANVGKWLLDTRKSIIVGPVHDDEVGDNEVDIMGLGTTMPGTVEILTINQARNAGRYDHNNGVPPVCTANWDQDAWAKFWMFVEHEKQLEKHESGHTMDTVQRFVEHYAKQGIDLTIIDDPRYDGGPLDVRKRHPITHRKLEIALGVLQHARTISQLGPFTPMEVDHTIELLDHLVNTKHESTVG